MNRSANQVETLLFKYLTVQLSGKFGTVELERTKLSTEILGALKPGFCDMRMFIVSEGQKYWLRVTDERLLDDKIVDMLDRKSLLISTENATHNVVVNSNHAKWQASAKVYSRRYKELLLSLVMVVFGIWLAGLRYGMNENAKAFIISSALSIIALLFVWTRGPLLRRIEKAGSQWVIRYWNNYNLPKTVIVPHGNVMVRTIVCRINGSDRVVDLLRADELVFFLVRSDKMFSGWSTLDAEILLNSGIRSIEHSGLVL